jgi:hypothetical protein
MAAIACKMENYTAKGFIGISIEIAVQATLMFHPQRTGLKKVSHKETKDTKRTKVNSALCFFVFFVSLCETFVGLLGF